MGKNDAPVWRQIDEQEEKGNTERERKKKKDEGMDDRVRRGEERHRLDTLTHRQPARRNQFTKVGGGDKHGDGPVAHDDHGIGSSCCKHTVLCMSARASSTRERARVLLLHAEPNQTSKRTITNHWSSRGTLLPLLLDLFTDAIVLADVSLLFIGHQPGGLERFVRRDLLQAHKNVMDRLSGSYWKVDLGAREIERVGAGRAI